ncbi:MAG: SHOCT domain-containing protein [Rhodospirillales bacterium]|nr:SHOCT domain-containing protein [Rhodospirillales bacterium]
MNAIRKPQVFSAAGAMARTAGKTLLPLFTGGMISISLATNAHADLLGNRGAEGFHMGWDNYGGMMLFGPVMMIGLVVLIVLVVVMLVGRGKQASESDGNANDRYRHALAILDERYAKGEIDHDEYEQRKRLLMT